MAEISIRGYVNQPKTVSGGKGEFAVFTLSDRQKEKDGTYTKLYYDCVDFNSGSPPPDGSFVTVKGWFSVKKYKKKDGTDGTGLSVNVQSLEIHPPKDAAPKADPTAAFDDLPF